jgi:hypothetical protein
MGKATIATVTAGAIVAATLVGGSAVGATRAYGFAGYAGGSMVQALNSTVTSALTASSTIGGTNPNNLSTNKAAGIAVSGLLTAGAVSTSSLSKPISGGYEVQSKVEIADASVLGGLITAKAITTTTTSTLLGTKGASNTSTTFVGLKIVGVTLPVTIPKNFSVSLPGVATVSLNVSLAGAQDSVAVGIGAAFGVTLLQPRAGNGVGASVILSPTYAAIATADVPDTGHSASGLAYGTQVTASAGKLVSVQSDPTAPSTVPFSGTGGKVVTASIAAINIAAALRIGAVTTTATGTNDTSAGDAATSAKVGSVNLFNGLIKAGAIQSTAHVRTPTNAASVITGSSTLASLVIAGKAVPLNAKPNTTINVLNLGTVTINQQVKTSTSITVRALDIKLSTAAYGLPAGAEVQVAVASAQAT